jgi:hypothetical protein
MLFIQIAEAHPLTDAELKSLFDELRKSLKNYATTSFTNSPNNATTPKNTTQKIPLDREKSFIHRGNRYNHRTDGAHFHLQLLNDD